MDPKIWVWIFLILYIIYCFYMGLKGFFSEKKASGYAIAGRSIPFIAFLMAATAASFSGWTFIGHPGLIWGAGLAYAYASFYVLTIPITGAFFAKRNWLMGKRYGFMTPGDMFAYYYNNEAVRWLTVLAAFLYSIFYSGLQLIAAAKLFYWTAGVPENRLVLCGHRRSESLHLGGGAPVLPPDRRYRPFGILYHHQPPVRGLVRVCGFHERS